MTLTPEEERRVARQLFRRAWELIDCQDRTSEQDRMMLVTACAAFLHWDAVGTEENRAIADWQIAHVASLLGYGDLALSHAASALSRVRGAGLPAWLHASVLEGLARAHAAAGNQAERDSYLKQAIEAVAAVTDAEERKLISAQIATVPRATTVLAARRHSRNSASLTPGGAVGVAAQAAPAFRDHQAANPGYGTSPGLQPRLWHITGVGLRPSYPRPPRPPSPPTGRTTAREELWQAVEAGGGFVSGHD